MDAGERRERRKGHLELARGQGDSRPFIHLLMNFLHRADRDRRGMYSGDLDLAAVAETVGLVSIVGEARKPEFRDKYGDFQTVIGLEGQRPVNAMTIAEATGIPRETVRRKLKLLVERGVIVERTRGANVFKPGYIQQPEMLDIIESGMRDALHFMNDCVKLGLVRWVDDAE
jgi:predicted transcriptional regulator